MRSQDALLLTTDDLDEFPGRMFVHHRDAFVGTENSIVPLDAGRDAFVGEGGDLISEELSWIIFLIL